MAIPNFLNSNYRYLSVSGITDVQSIIDNLVGELVTNGDWSVVSGGVGVSPTTLKSSVRPVDGAFIQVVITRNSATRIQYQAYDHGGLLINNQTSCQQDIDAGGTEVRFFTGTYHFCVDSIRATPECYDCGILDRSPSAVGVPRANYYSSQGPRSNTGTLSNQAVSSVFLLPPGTTSYLSGGNDGVVPRDPLVTSAQTSVTGAYITFPYELCSTIYSMGRAYQAILVPSSLSFGTEITVTIDTGVTAVFKVVGRTTTKDCRLAMRKP